MPNSSLTVLKLDGALAWMEPRCPSGQWRGHRADFGQIAGMAALLMVCKSEGWLGVPIGCAMLTSFAATYRRSLSSGVS
jgi:hypothetical protein